MRNQAADVVIVIVMVIFGLSCKGVRCTSDYDVDSQFPLHAFLGVDKHRTFPSSPPAPTAPSPKIGLFPGPGHRGGELLVLVLPRLLLRLPKPNLNLERLIVQFQQSTYLGR